MFGSNEEMAVTGPDDAVMPLLQRIQKEISDSRRSLEAKINDIAESQAKSLEKTETIEGYLTYSMGLLSQRSSDIAALREDVDALKVRLAEVERRV